ncbi:unnamed protein product [Cylindrotheca closterium]|uniref:Cytosine-specific methyltransferase n=1 Tax=Cylindrotheca closterium TaxID=2856 RepID=A0AAD2FR56_9STRA|nr:unnamed protein product [Cylindrotheca closterium]
MGKNKKRVCYHCGLPNHRAKDCPQATCRLCGETGHDVGACPQKPLDPVDLGSFLIPPASHSNDNNERNFTYIELFAGIGGFRIALDRLGGQCVFSSEVDRFARASYEKNHGDRPAGDITRIPEQDIPSHDMLVGGFPCQSFSFSGERKGFDDHRGVLFLEIVRILKKHQPRVILLENVRGLLTHEDGKTLQVIISHLDQVGYNVKHKLLDAVYLVPQERKRIYMVGIRKDLVTATDASSDYEFPDIPNLKRGFQDILQTNMEPSMLENLRLSDHQLQKVRNQKYTQQFPEARFLSDFLRPTKTLQSSYASYMVGSQFIKLSLEDNDSCWRKLSPREAARLQGFPDSFELCPSRPYHLLGNAVVPSMISLIAAGLLPFLDDTMMKTKESTATIGWRIASELLLEACPEDRKSALRLLLDERGHDMINI